MKNLFNKILITTISVLCFGLLTGCNPEQEIKTFKVEFKEAGAGYVALMAQVPNATKVCYTIREKAAPMITAAILAKNSETEGTYDYFYTDGVQRLSGHGVDIKENSHYHMYLVAELPGGYSDLYHWEFDTGEFTFTELATILGVLPDGYVVHLEMPETVTPLSAAADSTGSRAIRYSHSNIMMYNMRRSSSDDYEFLLYNGGNSIREDKTLEFSDRTNWGGVGYDADGDGEVTDDDQGVLWDYIAPGEPIVFIAGEFEYMKEPWSGKTGADKDEAVKDFQNKYNRPADDDNYVVNGFYYPAGWRPGYYLPCLDSTKFVNAYAPAQGGEDEDDDPAVRNVGVLTNMDFSSPIDGAWTGAFQRKVFRTRVPAVLNAGVTVKASNIRSVDATITITPDKNVYRYVYLILDDAAYNDLINTYLSGHDEYLQWAVSSYFAMMTFSAVAVEPNPLGDPHTAATTKLNLSDYFLDVPADTKYHVLVTAMGGEEVSAPQSFTHYRFSTPRKTKENGPTIEVTALGEDEPGDIRTSAFEAAFNIKCTSVADNPVVRCYYGANYYKDWVLSVNGQSSSYETLGQSAQFTEAEVAQINSPAGLNIKIPSIDGEKTRLVVVGFNDENISNGLDKVKKENILNHPSVADCVTPYFAYEPSTLSQAAKYFSDKILDGEWTLHATVLNGGVEEKMTAPVEFKSDGFVVERDFPATLPDDVFNLYDEVTEWTSDEIKAHFETFVTLAAGYNQKRLRNQNKILMTGWLNHESHGYTAYKSPWDMFIDEEVSTVDVESLFSEFGPKLFVEVYRAKDGADSLALTSDYYFASPAVNYNQTPFYLAGVNHIPAVDENNPATTEVVFYFSGATAGSYASPLEFPVVLTEDKDSLIIKGFEAKGVTWYPNMVGEDTRTGQYIIEKPIVSDVVLTRNVGEETVPEPDAPAVRSLRRRAQASNVVALQELPKVVYKHKTKFAKPVPVIERDGEVLTVEKMRRSAAEFRKKYFKSGE